MARNAWHETRVVARWLVPAALLVLSGCAAEASGIGACESAPSAAEAERACTRVADDATASVADRAFALALRGGARQASGNLEAGVRDQDEAVRLAPGDARVLANRGALRGMRGDLDGADADLAAALAIDPKLVLALGNQAIVLSKRGKFLEARAVIDRAIAVDGTAYQLWAERCWGGAVLADDLARTLQDCEKAAAMEPRDPNNFNNLGFVHYRLGQYEKSIAHYSKSLEGNEAVASSWLMRGLARRASGADGADTDIETARRLDPGVAERYAGYGITVE